MPLPAELLFDNSARLNRNGLKGPRINLAASLADRTSVRYGAVVTESARIRRLQAGFGGRPEEPDPPADADPGTQHTG